VLQQLGEQLLTLQRSVFLSDVRSDDAVQEPYEDLYGKQKTCKPCHIDGAVHFDLANQGKALLSMIDLNIRLFRNDDAFCLNNYDLNTNYKIKVRSLRLNVDTWDLTPGMNIELENTLRTQMALYDQVRTEVKTFTIPAGMKSAPEHALFTGIVPQR
jgi:hypothetical protein